VVVFLMCKMRYNLGVRDAVSADRKHKVVENIPWPSEVVLNPLFLVLSLLSLSLPSPSIDP